jgi:Flp pilus assembly protein TadG
MTRGACFDRIRTRTPRVPTGNRADTGSATAELVLLIPTLVLMLWFLVFCGRMVDARMRIEDVAHQAARAASSQRVASSADVRARTTAAEALNDAGTTCRSVEVETGGSVQPGGVITTTVTCRVDLSDLALLQLPGTVALQAGFSASVDVHRGITNTSMSPGR